MEAIKGFFSRENMVMLFDQFYRWAEGRLEAVFGNYTYEPLKVLFINPYFWMIIIAFIVLGVVFRRR